MHLAPPELGPKLVHTGLDRTGDDKDSVLAGAALRQYGLASSHALAAMRGIKAEGGRGVVNTEDCSVHPGLDNAP
jgi:hypothetical protein